MFNINKEGIMRNSKKDCDSAGVSSDAQSNIAYEPGEIPNVLYLGDNFEYLGGKIYESAILKLKNFRDRRKKPFIDRVKYSSLNGNIIYSITELSKIFNPFDLNRQKLNKIGEISIKFSPIHQRQNPAAKVSLVFIKKTTRQTKGIRSCPNVPPRDVITRPNGLKIICPAS